jgi:hypothetical protein
MSLRIAGRSADQNDRGRARSGPDSAPKPILGFAG